MCTRNPYFLSTDQGSNVDGATMRDISNSLGIEKRRSSAYHSPGNGFEERNVRSIKDILRSVLLERHLNQSKWHSVLAELVSALNTGFSKSFKFILPFSIAPQFFDKTYFQDKTVNEHDNLSLIEYEEEITSILPDVYNHVITSR